MTAHLTVSSPTRAEKHLHTGSSGAEYLLWMLARIPKPCLVDDRPTWPKIAKCPCPPVDFVSTFSQTRSFENFVRAAIAFCALRQ